MGLFQSSHAILLLFLLACSLDRTTSQEDTTTATATTAPSCNGAGSIVTAVIVTFLLTVLLLVAGSVWWRRYKTKKDSNHLILETDPEKGRGEYAFDNPGFKDASLSVPTKQAFETGKNDLPKSKWQQWTPLSAFTVKSERRKALDDSVIEGNEIKVVSLKSHDFTGLGFNICGNMKEGIFVKDLLQRGPASESGKLNPGDRIHSVTINFEHMVYEDALTILGYASPYEVTVQATSGKLTSSSPEQGGHPSHPMYRSSSWSDLYKVGKQSKRQLFGDDPNDLSSTYSSLQKSRSNVTTLERQDSKSAQKPQKFGVKVLPLELQQKSPKIAEQNENNLNIEKHQLDVGAASVDEVDDPKKPPPVKRREKKHQEEFQRNSLNGSGIKRTAEGIPLELPPHLSSAASAALDVRGRRKGKAPAAPADEPNSDSDADGDGSTIELNAAEVTVHQVEEERVPSRKTLSAGDLRQVATLERAQSLELSERPLDDEVLHAPRLSLALDGLGTFERNRLKKSSDWGELQDAVEADSNVEVKNQIWPSLDSLNEPVMPRSGRPAVLVEEPVKKPPPTPEKPPVRRVVNNRIDEPFEAARGCNLVAGGGDKFPPSWDLTKSTSSSLEDQEKTVPNDKTASKNEDSVDAIIIEQEETAAEEAKPTGSSQEVESLAPKSGTFVAPFEADKDSTFNHPGTIKQKILDETASPSSPKVGNAAASAGAVEFPATKNGITSEDSKTFNVVPGMNIKNQSTKISTSTETAANNSEAAEFPATKNGLTSEDSKTFNVLPGMNIKNQSTKIATWTETAANNSEAAEFPAAKNGLPSEDSKTFNVLPGINIKNASTKITTLTETAANNSAASEFPAAKNGITSEDSNIFNVLPGMNIKNESTKTSTETAANNSEAVENDTVFDKSVENKKITNEPVAVDPVLPRKNVDNTLGSNEVINSYMEFSAVENEREPAVVKTMGSNGFAESSSPAVEAETETVIEVPHFPSEDEPVINNYFFKPPSHSVAEDAPVIEPSGEATTASIVLETTNKSPRTKSYTSFEIPMNESRSNRRQRLPDEPKPTTKPAEVLSKIPLLNSMVENQRRVGNLTDETKNIVTLNTVPDLLDLTQSFLQTEQLSSFSYGPHTNVPDDIKVSRHSKETSRHVSNVSVSNGNAELHSLELSINENKKEVEESTSNPTYVTEIQVTTQAPTEENELAKIKEIAERQLKKLPEMRFTTSSYEPSRLPEKRHSTIEHLRSNFEKPKLTRQESSSSLKSRIPIATTAKTPPTSPERRDSRHIDVEHDQAILELMSRSVGATPTKPQVKAGSKNVTVTSIRSGSKIPSGLPTLGGGKSPPRRADNGHESGFKQWVFNPSNVTNVVVTDVKRD